MKFSNAPNTRIQRLLDDFIFVEKGRGLHVQRMLKMSRGNLSKMFGGEKIGDLIFTIKIPQ